MTSKKDIIELRKLINRWKKRRNKLGKNTGSVGKIKNIANQLLSRELLGEFKEIERCSSQLVAILNRMEKENK